MLGRYGFTKELEQEFDTFVVWLITFHTKLIKSPQKLLDRCKQYLSPNQNEMLNNTLLKNYKILALLEGLKKKY